MKASEVLLENHGLLLEAELKKTKKIQDMTDWQVVTLLGMARSPIGCVLAAKPGGYHRRAYNRIKQVGKLAGLSKISIEAGRACVGCIIYIWMLSKVGLYGQAEEILLACRRAGTVDFGVGNGRTDKNREEIFTDEENDYLKETLKTIQDLNMAVIYDKVEEHNEGWPTHPGYIDGEAKVLGCEACDMQDGLIVASKWIEKKCTPSESWRQTGYGVFHANHMAEVVMMWMPGITIHPLTKTDAWLIWKLRHLFGWGGELEAHRDRYPYLYCVAVEKRISRNAVEAARSVATVIDELYEASYGEGQYMAVIAERNWPSLKRMIRRLVYKRTNVVIDVDARLSLDEPAESPANVESWLESTITPRRWRRESNARMLEKEMLILDDWEVLPGGQQSGEPLSVSMWRWANEGIGHICEAVRMLTEPSGDEVKKEIITIILGGKRLLEV